MISGALAVIESAEERNALNEIYVANSNRFYSVAYSKLHNSSDAEDAVQEAFLRIADCPENFFRIPEKKRVSYIDAIIRNVSIEMLFSFGRLISDDYNRSLRGQNMRTEHKLKSAIRRKKQALGLKDSQTEQKF